MKMNYLLQSMAIWCFCLALSCSSKQDTNENTFLKAEKYTCPMHPEIISDKPGACPICGMALVSASGLHATEMMFTSTQLKLANVTTKKITTTAIAPMLRLNARLSVANNSVTTINSRADGRIEKLYIKETGAAIKQGQPLYELYSEELAILQKEYLLARETPQNKANDFTGRSFEKAARQKLIRYGLTDQQIDALNATKDFNQRTIFRAPVTGVMTKILVTEGEYVSNGSPLYQITDLSTLWVEAEIYPDETHLIKVGDQVNAIMNDGEILNAKVILLSREHRGNSQIVVARAAIENKHFSYRPGERAEIVLTHSKRPGIILPSNAVIREKNHAVVFVQKGRNTFIQRLVSTGFESDHDIEITSGLTDGDSVAVTGAYLLHAEFVLKNDNEQISYFTDDHRHQ